MPSGVYDRDTETWREARVKISKALQTDEPSYTSLHRTVRVFRGTPSLCEHCGVTEGKFEWANVSGNFKDINDYIRLCTKCHAKFDPERWEKIYSHPDAFKETACDVCGRVFRGARACSQHKTKMHLPRESVFCVLCGKICATDNGLRVHTLRMHSPVITSTCDICNRKFESARNMKHHRTKSHGPKSDRRDRECFCILCGKVFSAPQGLAAHRVSKHTVHAPASCDLCGRTFTNQRNLTHHVTVAHRNKKEA